MSEVRTEVYDHPARVYEIEGLPHILVMRRGSVDSFYVEHEDDWKSVEDASYPFFQAARVYEIEGLPHILVVRRGSVDFFYVKHGDDWKSVEDAFYPFFQTLIKELFP